MAAIKQLYDLQSVDLELDWRNARLAEIGRALGDDSALKPARAEVARRKVAAQKAGGEQTNLDTIIGGFEAKIAEADAKLYGGTVKLARELQDLQADIDMLKRQRAEQEDLLLSVLEQVDETKKSYETGARTVAKREAAWIAEQESMTSEQAVLEGELSGLQADREARAKGVPAPELALYDQIRNKTHGKAVAVLHGATCDACQTSIPNKLAQEARTADKPVRCSNCGLILLVA